MTRTTSELDLLLHLDVHSAPPLHTQLEQQLRHAILAGSLHAATPLPSTRALAAELRVSRGVVVEAYEQLIAEGYLVAERGSGTRVSTLAGDQAARRQPRREIEAQPRFDFRPGSPDLSLFPRAPWLTATRRALNDAPNERLGYGDPHGTAELREALAAYLGRVRGARADPDRMVITTGLAQAFALIARTLRARGARRLAVEDPGSADARAQFATAGMEFIPVAVDDRGLRVDELALTDADAVLVTPAHQFPTGVVLAPERRAELISWAATRGALVIEDDYDSEYRYDRPPVGVLQGLRPECVIYGGSTSKTLAPALRLGWIVAPAEIAQDIASQKQLADHGGPSLDQLAMAEFLTSGELDRHVRRTRPIYRRRRDALLSAMARYFPLATVAGIAAGLHLTAHLPRDMSDIALAELAAQRGVAVTPAAGHRLRPGPPALLLGYSRMHERAIERGVCELAAAANHTSKLRMSRTKTG
jgi:GntR family transcriptional regulator/MocR family aminotransferase